jgi:hypothetical protein
VEGEIVAEEAMDELELGACLFREKCVPAECEERATTPRKAAGQGNRPPEDRAQDGFLKCVELPGYQRSAEPARGHLK